MRIRVCPLKCAAALIGALALTGPVDAAQGGHKLDHALRSGNSGKNERVIIRSKPGRRAELTQALKACGYQLKGEHALVDAVTAELGTDCLQKLIANDVVESVAKDADVHSSASESDFISIPSNTLRSTLGEGEYSTGAGIGVAIIDSGIAPLPAFGNRIVGFYDFTSDSIVATSPHDEYGHGTHVAGLIGAYDSQYMGVAPQAHFLGLRVLDKNGKGRTSHVIRAIEFAVANRARFNIHIINLSLGHPILAPAADDALVQAVEAAVRAGLIVTVSAGNYGTSEDTNEIAYAGITSPGNAPSAITVGAVNTKGTVSRADDEVTPYSSRGPSWYDGFVKPDVVAPGHALISVTDANSYLYKKYPSLQLRNGNKRYIKLSGTSMATAVTTGVVATVLQASGWSSAYYHVAPLHLSANAVKALVQYTALPLPGLDELTQGTGGVNAEGAVRFAWAATALAANPQAFNANPAMLAPASTIGGTTIAWATRITWGQNI